MNINYLKGILFSLVFAFVIQVAQAQKNDSKTEMIKKSKSLNVRDAEVQENVSKWMYSIALVSKADKGFKVRFLEPSNPETVAERENMILRKKFMEIANKITSEVDLINLFSSMGMELIGVVPETDSKEQTVKYYLRSVLEPDK